MSKSNKAIIAAAREAEKLNAPIDFIIENYEGSLTESTNYPSAAQIEHAGNIYDVLNAHRRTYRDKVNGCEGTEFVCNCQDACRPTMGVVITIRFKEDEAAFKFITIMTGAIALPQWFISFAHSKAYEDGHSSGSEEVFQIFEGMVYEANQIIQKYGKN